MPWTGNSIPRQQEAGVALRAKRSSSVRLTKLLSRANWILGLFALGILPCFAIAQDEKPAKSKEPESAAQAKKINADEASVPAPTLPSRAEPSQPTISGLHAAVVAAPTASIEDSSKLVDSRDDSTRNIPLTEWRIRADLLYWQTRGVFAPPLVTTDSPLTPEAIRGNLNNGTSRLLYGDQMLNDRFSSGGRFSIERSLDSCGCLSSEIGFLFLGRQGEHFMADGLVVGRPFIRPDGTPDRQLASTPGIVPGDFASVGGRVDVDSFLNFFGTEANVKQDNGCWGGVNVRSLLGFRYWNLDDRLHIHENITSFRDIPGLPFLNSGNRFLVFDYFDARNQFYGGQVGLSLETQRGPWNVSATAKVGIGATVSEVDIAGGQIITTPTGNRTPFQGGLLALDSNIGHHERNRFSTVSEIGVKVGYCIFENLRLNFGYDFIYWSRVLRAADQIDTVLDPARIPNFGFAGAHVVPARPAVLLRDSDFWAHGISFGIELRY